MDKNHILKEDKAKWVHREKQILSKLKHPNIISLFYTFQDKANLCKFTYSLLYLTVARFWSFADDHAQISSWSIVLTASFIAKSKRSDSVPTFVVVIYVRRLSRR